MPIINTVLAGGGDIVEAYTEATLVKGDKVKLVPNAKELVSVSGLPSVSSSSSGLIALLGDFVIGTAGFGVYQINPDTNVVTQVESTTAIPSNNFSKAFGPIYQHMYGGSVLFMNAGGGYYATTLGNTSFNGSYDAVVGGSPEGFVIREQGNTNTIVEHASSSGEILFYSDSSAVIANVSRIVHENNMIVWGSVMKKYTFNEDGTFTETDLTDSTCASNFTYQNRFLNLDNKNYLTLGPWTNNTSTNLSAFRLDEKTSSSYDFVSVPLPKVVTACVNGKKITAMGSLAGNRFYISTSSVTTSETNLRDYLYVFSIPGSDISSAVLDDIIQTDDRGYRMMFMSYEGDYVLDCYMSSTSGAPTLRKRAENGYEYTAYVYDGIPSGAGTLTGIVDSVTGSVVKVKTVLPPPASLTITSPADTTLSITTL